MPPPLDFTDSCTRLLAFDVPEALLGWWGWLGFDLLGGFGKVMLARVNKN